MFRKAHRFLPTGTMLRDCGFTSLKPPPLGGPKLSLESDIVGHLRCTFGASWGEYLALGPV